MTYYKGYLSKQQKINELEEEITSLKSKLRYQERTAKEGFFLLIYSIFESSSKAEQSNRRQTQSRRRQTRP